MFIEIADIKMICICPNCNIDFSFRASFKSKYCSGKCHKDDMWNNTKIKIELTQLFANVKQARRYLIEKYGIICYSCKLTKWLDKPIPLVCDHINGNSRDWSILNIRMLCCNCDALTDTYKGKNRGNGRHYRRIRYAEGKSF